jgi:hypothetical protein
MLCRTILCYANYSSTHSPITQPRHDAARVGGPSARRCPAVGCGPHRLHSFHRARGTGTVVVVVEVEVVVVDVVEVVVEEVIRYVNTI